MLKSEIISGCVRTSLNLDINAVLSEMTAANLIFNPPEQSDRGVTHQYVEDVFLRGHARSYFFNGGLESENDENNPEMEKLPTLKKLLQQLPNTVGRAALLSLDGESVISLHRDSDRHGYFENTLRFHAPIITYDDVKFFNEGKFYQMRAGEVWTINNLGRHGVINDNPAPRLHLVFDVFINEGVADYAINGDTSLGIAASEQPELLGRLTAITRKQRAAEAENKTEKPKRRVARNYNEARDLARLMELQREQMQIMRRIKRHRESKQ